MKKKRKVRKRVLIPAILLVLILAAIIVVRLNLGKMKFKDDSSVILNMEVLETETEKFLRAEEVYDCSKVVLPAAEELEDTFTLLVIGGSAPEAEESGGREDAQAIILMSINHSVGEVIFHTLHKDLYVDIPETGGHRLANAYAVGGGPLLARTITENFGIYIDNYAAVSMGDVARIIEMPAFEGIDVSKDGIEVVEEMLYQLNAVQPMQVAGYISNVLPYVTHNMTSGDIMKMVLQIPKVVSYYSEKYSVPEDGDAGEIEGYLVVDAETVSEKMKGRIYRKDQSETEAN